MSKKPAPKKSDTSYPGYSTEKKIGKIQQYVLKKNGLRVLFVPKPGTNVVTSSIVYKVGSRDEGTGETGLAHMLEHMLFKPTETDKKLRRDSDCMTFERETGVILNANTWNDRTQYYFSYPVEHFERAIRIESERMRGVVLEEKTFRPEQGNVLSEFDMYNGDPTFALGVVMSRAAFMHHPYGHETIGFRNDIENYTPEKLKAFYDKYYWPNNATYIIAGDIEVQQVLATIKKYFEGFNATKDIPRHHITEMKQEGIRTVHLERPTPETILAIGVKHEHFPSKNWFATQVLGTLLTDGPDSLLYKKLVDTGLASKVSGFIAPFSETGLGTIYIHISEAGKKKDIFKIVNDTLHNLDAKTIEPFLKKTVAGVVSDEAFTRHASLGLVAEMAEYESADAIEEFWKSEKILTSITAKQLEQLATELFAPVNMTIGTLNYKLFA